MSDKTFDAEAAVIAMSELELDWQRDNYLDELHPEYEKFNPAAKADTWEKKIERFNCNRYTNAGWHEFRTRLVAVCEYLDIDVQDVIEPSLGSGSSPDIYTMKALICRAVFTKIRKERPPRPFKTGTQIHKLLVKDSVIYVYENVGEFYYYIENHSGIDCDCEKPYKVAWEALEAGVERLFDYPMRYGIEV